MNFLASLSAGATILFFSGQFEVNLSCRRMKKRKGRKKERKKERTVLSEA